MEWCGWRCFLFYCLGGGCLLVFLVLDLFSFWFCVVLDPFLMVLG